MATQIRIEFANIYRDDTAYPTMRSMVPTEAINMSVGPTATAANDRPEVPAGYDFALITALNGDVIVAPPGDDPTATQTSGKLLRTGIEEEIPVREGQLLSFIELAAV